MMSPTSGDGSSPGRHRPDWLTQPLSEQKQLAAGPPVDYSFKDLKTVIDLVLVEPTSGTARKPAVPPDTNPLEYLEALAAADQDAATAAAAAQAHSDLDPLPRQPALSSSGAAGGGGASGAASPTGPGGTAAKAAAAQALAAQASSGAAAGRGGGGQAGSPGAGALGARLNSNSLRLCNNHLMSLSGLGRVMRHVLDDPAQLVWLDVSSNQLSTIEDTVLEFPSLQVLYYHGNNITNLNDVLKLQSLPRLNKLTLHGNPISEGKNYKFWVVAHLPGLRNMDFGPITKIERDKIDVWFKSTKKKH